MNAWDKFLVWAEATCGLALLCFIFASDPTPECAASPTKRWHYVGGVMIAYLLVAPVGRGFMVALGKNPWVGK